MLVTIMVVKAEGAAPIPPHLTAAEASTLPCAALTAWSAIVTLGQVRAGDQVLVQGTGGVSLFALQFAKARGAVVTVTSSSPQKLAAAKALGADHGVNYRDNPRYAEEIRDLTGGLDHVVEVGGAETLDGVIRSIKPGGTISLIGVLSAADGAGQSAACGDAARALAGRYGGVTGRAQGHVRHDQRDRPETGDRRDLQL